MNEDGRDDVRRDPRLDGNGGMGAAHTVSTRNLGQVADSKQQFIKSQTNEEKFPAMELTIRNGQTLQARDLEITLTSLIGEEIAPTDGYAAGGGVSVSLSLRLGDFVEEIAMSRLEPTPPYESNDNIVWKGYRLEFIGDAWGPGAPESITLRVTEPRSK